ncbi:MAG: Hsp20/alpha crystallin family protein [Candidatus Brocadia sp.]|nr:Hsp20/alpha crystallin family protein [Candidatus Brocadia sp.]
MNLVKWDRLDPLNSLTHIQREMSDLLDILSSAPQTEGYVSAEFPPIIVSTSEDNILVRAEIPGIRISDLDVQVVDDVLTIKGERKPVATTAKITYLRRERNYGTFARSIMLPEKADVEKVTASYKNGVLTVKLPKAAETKPKQVVIKKA